MTERIIQRIIEDEMKTSYLGYAMSVIVGRALPDARDGLKPVHRRILFGMWDTGVTSSKPTRKCARIVGDVMGRYHPHGNLAVYDALVRMAQDWNLRYPLVQGQGNFGCFTKDTRVRLADGRTASFGELVEESKVGKRNFTFTVRNDGSIVIAEIKHPRLTKQKAALVTVVLDDGEEIKCTPDHRFRLRDGSYVQAHELTPGTSLMPGYFRISDENPAMIGYEMIFQPGTNIWTHCHTLADEWNVENHVYPRSAGRVRHHVDFNKSNNNPTNILRMQWGAHFTLHAQHAAQLHESAEYRTKISAGRARYWSKEDVRQGYSQRIAERNRERWRDPEYRQKMTAFLSDVNRAYCKAHPEVRKEYSARASETMKRMWRHPAYRQLFHEKIVASNKKRTTNSTGRVKFLRVCHATIAEHQMLTKKLYEETRKQEFGTSFTSWDCGLVKYFNNDVHALLAEVCQNHKVTRVERSGEVADVYDLTVESTHNFLLAAGVFVHNSVDGDPPAADRYTEARLNKLSEELLQDLDKETVPFVPNFDATLKEPTVLPAKLPNLLINGSAGIAVGMATNIPPHNLREVCTAAISLLEQPALSDEELLVMVPGPDFPTGGIILGREGIRDAYRTGRGKISVRARTTLEEHKGKGRIIVNEIPYQVNKAQLVEQIAEMIRDKKVVGISDLRDESDREGLRIVMELKTGANPQTVLNQLFAHTRLQETFGIIMLALDGNQPKVMSLREMLTIYLTHRQTMVRNRTKYDLTEAEKKAHILEGLVIALDNIDPVIVLIKQAKSAEEARQSLKASYNLTEEQASAVLDMKLQKLTSLEQGKLRAEHKETLQRITELRSILADERRIRGIIKTELAELSEKYGDARRTTFQEASKVEEFQLVPPEDVVVTLTHAGYVKRMPADTYKQQKRGGKGIIATTTKEEDIVSNLYVANTRDTLLVFTNLGKVHWVPVHEVPEASRQARGTAIINLVALAAGESVQAIIPIKTFDPARFLLMVTRDGTVKKTSLEEFSNPRRGGIIALGIENDELRSVLLTDGQKEILIATRNGMAVRFHERDVRAMGRTAYGVTGIKLKGEDKVVAAMVADEKKQVLTITEKGYGKRTPVPEYRLIGRGGIGVTNIKVTEKNGPVVAALSVTDDDELMLISKSGQIIRTQASEVSIIGRATQGVRVMRVEEDHVVAATVTNA